MNGQESETVIALDELVDRVRPSRRGDMRALQVGVTTTSVSVITCRSPCRPTWARRIAATARTCVYARGHTDEEHHS
jgi:hypothetical protein